MILKLIFYQELFSFKIALLVPPPCDLDPCENDGVCTDDGPGSKHNCNCSDSYVGDNCEQGRVLYTIWFRVIMRSSGDMWIPSHPQIICIVVTIQKILRQKHCQSKLFSRGAMQERNVYAVWSQVQQLLWRSRQKICGSLWVPRWNSGHKLQPWR